MLKKYRTAIIQLKRQLLAIKDGTELTEKDRTIQDLQAEKLKVCVADGVTAVLRAVRCGVVWCVV